MRLSTVPSDVEEKNSQTHAKIALMKRSAKVSRKTKETDIAVTINIDGSGKSNLIPNFFPFLSPRERFITYLTYFCI